MIRKFPALALAACAIALLASGARADDFSITRLEQDVLELRRDVQLLQRQLEALQHASQAVAMGTPAGSATTVMPAASGGDSKWVNQTSWTRLRPGMSELEVIATLGAPTSMRSGNGDATVVMFYALEIGHSGFLSGSVSVANHRVVEIKAPVLKVTP